MQITGRLLIAGEWVLGEAGGFQAVNPATGSRLEPTFEMASAEQVAAAAAAAARAAAELRQTPLLKRAAFLRECAKQIVALGAVLIERAALETGLPEARIESERARTCNQLHMFADLVLAGDFLHARIDTAQPDRTPLPRPDLRSVRQSIGPVSVFGASNFPLAFSVAGGDTASAFAAGCPVLVKGHPSHPGTAELVARALDRAARQLSMPDGAFSLLNGSNADVGAALVTAPEIKAVGFTGSFRGGTALIKLAAARPEPIPVFAEMGSLNPVIVLPHALEQNAESIAERFVESMTLGVGQFCTKPGLVLGIEGPGLERFCAAATAKIEEQPNRVMLNATIRGAYEEIRAQVAAEQGVSVTAEGAEGHATLLKVSGSSFLRSPQLTQEIFGPASLIVQCADVPELHAAVASLPGQLTGTIHASAGEATQYGDLMYALSERVGRLILNGFPTGVEVCHSMVHGGPYPASSDSRFTSVGTAAVDRFMRPLCFQNYSDELLPEPLQNVNPWGILRLINGEVTRNTIQK